MVAIRKCRADRRRRYLHLARPVLLDIGDAERTDGDETDADDERDEDEQGARIVVLLCATDTSAKEMKTNEFKKPIGRNWKREILSSRYIKTLSRLYATAS